LFDSSSCASEVQLAVPTPQAIFDESVAKLYNREFLEGMLPAGSLTKYINKYSVKSRRQRGFSWTDTLLAWVKQSLSGAKSCRAVVINNNKLKKECGLPPMSENNAAYCKARQRVPENLAKDLCLDLAAEMENGPKDKFMWKGRNVILVDGTKVSMMDTEANQMKFPQPTTQKKGAGFPQARIVFTSSLSTGAFLDAAIGPYAGKLSGEHALFRSILDNVARNSIILGDAYYPSFFHIADIMNRGIDGVFALKGKRKLDLKDAKKLGESDYIVTWNRPKRPQWMSQDAYNKVPKSIKLRTCLCEGELESGKNEEFVLVTTLLDDRQYTHKELRDLYIMRWKIEVRFRSIKCAQKMEFINCRTPAMVVKDIWTHMLGYNIIIKIMAQTAFFYDKIPTNFSFTAAKTIFGTYVDSFITGRSKFTDTILNMCSAMHYHVVGNRPGRVEPRVQKMRPKQYPYVTTTRAEAREKAQTKSAEKNPKESKKSTSACSERDFEKSGLSSA